MARPMKYTELSPDSSAKSASRDGVRCTLRQGGAMPACCQQSRQLYGCAAQLVFWGARRNPERHGQPPAIPHTECCVVAKPRWSTCIWRARPSRGTGGLGLGVLARGAQPCQIDHWNRGEPLNFSRHIMHIHLTLASQVLALLRV